MNRSRKQRPQYPAREGLIISGDPAGRVMERGFAGGRVSRDPADAVAYQAAFVGRATGRYQSPERRPYEERPDWLQMEDAPRWSPPRRGPHDFSPERIRGEEPEWNCPEEHWQQRHESPPGGFSGWRGNYQRRSRSRERFSPGPRERGGRRRGRIRGRVGEMRENRFPGEFNEPGNWDRPPEDHPVMREDRFPGEFNEPGNWDRPPEDHPVMREDRFPGEFNEPGNWDRPPEHHPFNEFGEERGGGWESQRFGVDRSPLRDPGPSQERESPVLSRWDGPRRSRSSRRDRDSPRREHGSPRRGHGSPRRGHGSPRRDRGTPRRDRGSPRRDRGSPRRDRGSPRRDRGSPRRDRGSPRRDRGSPRRGPGSPRRGPGSPRRERGFESVWGRLGPKYDMSPEPPRRALSFERHRRRRSPINEGRRGGREEPNYDPRNIPPDFDGPVNQNLPQPGPRGDYWDGPREVQGDPGPSRGPSGPDQSWGGPHGRVPEGPRVDDGRGTPRSVHSHNDHPGSGREWVGPGHPVNVMAKPHSEPSSAGPRENLGWNAPGPRENMFGLEEHHSGDESDHALSFEAPDSGGEPSENSDGFPDDPDAEGNGAEEDKNSNDEADGPDDEADGPTPYWERSVQEWDKPVTEEEINAAAGKPPKSSKTPAQKKDKPAQEKDKPVQQKVKPAQQKDKPAQKKDMGLFDQDKQVAVVLEDPRLGLEKKDGYYIRTCLIKDVQKALASGNGPELRFLRSGVIPQGWFLITCGNDETLDWLLKWQPPKVENYTLVVKRRSELPQFHKIGFWISSVELTVPEILKILKGQNGRLETKHWKNLGSRKGKQGIFLTFRIDSESLEALRSYKWSLCFELHTVRVYRPKNLGEGSGYKGHKKKSAGPSSRKSMRPGPGPIRQPMPTIASSSSHQRAATRWGPPAASSGGEHTLQGGHSSKK